MKTLATLLLLVVTYTFAFGQESITSSETPAQTDTKTNKKKTAAEPPEELDEKEFDIQLFSGTNLDPGNPNSAITNFSFEGLLKGQILQKLFFRLGGYSNRNFTRDSASALPVTRYIRVEPKEALVIDSSKLAIQRFQLDNKVTTKSYGFYFNLMVTALEREFTDGHLRVYFSFSPELVLRRRESVLAVTNSVLLDTIVYTKGLADRNTVTVSTQTTSENIFTPKIKLEEGYANLGVILEIIHSKYELFFFPSVAKVYSRRFDSFKPQQVGKANFGTFNAKILLNAKLLGVQVGLDAKGILSNSSFYNFSIGIPLGLNQLREKFQDNDESDN